MKKPELVGALEGLGRLRPSDLPRYKQAMAAGSQHGWGYFLPYLLTRNRPGKSAVLFSVDEDSVCVYLWRREKGVERLDLPVAPAPISPAVLRRGLERCNEFNGNRSARILRIDERDAPIAASVSALRVEQRRSQYLYRPSDMLDAEGRLDLGGRRYRTVRRNVALVEALPGIAVAPYAPDVHEAACRGLLERWGARHRALHGTAGGVGSARRALELAREFSEPDLWGEIVEIEDRVVAFALGGEIRPDLGCFFEAKADPDVRGLSYFQRASFLSKMGAMDCVNDGSDVGREGLRQLKQSLRPVAMHLEYRGFQEAELA